ncbi:MAG: hypothetical protein F6K22_38630 [Okeania sp. SIO2F4]|nr:hypothetical protein [Okeania sp. SIO2F4]NES08175.1 hypothetical protein [Okeania sp. SIO2F4]
MAIPPYILAVTIFESRENVLTALVTTMEVRNQMMNLESGNVFLTVPS